MKKILFLFLLFSVIFLIIPFLLVHFFPKTIPVNVSVAYQIPETISVYQTQTNTISELPLEECVKRNLVHTSLENPSIESLKAQAVATRSYLLNKLSANPHENAMLCDDANHCMNFVETTSTLEIHEQAVSETAGEYLSYQNLPAKTCYFHVSSGKTESSYDVWNVEIPYLISVSSESDSRAAKFQSKVFYPMRAWKTTLLGAKKMNFENPPLGEIIKSENGHVKEMILYGTPFTGHELKSLFHLNSTNFSLSIQDEQAIFLVRGDGHGVGMSQYGARVMAENGYDYQQILAHYYPGTELIKKQ